jgi:DNA-binding NtrC family response regulator
VDIRVVSATNRDLNALMKDGAFRPDLYARICELVAELPPLRDRVEEVPLLVEHFLRKHGHGGRRVEIEAMEALCCWRWPLNVRQLESAVRRALLLGEDGALSLELFDGARSSDPSLSEESPRSSRAEPSASYRQAIRLWEALRRHEGDVNLAAEELGISRSQLYRRAKKFGIEVARFRS